MRAHKLTDIPESARDAAATVYDLQALSRAATAPSGLGQ